MVLLIGPYGNSVQRDMNMFGLSLLLSCALWLFSEGTILDVRLVDGDSMLEGRVEINVEGVGWNTICGSTWDMNDAMVTCRQLGFTGTQLDVQGSQFGTVVLPLAKKSLFCKGKEETLNECSMQAATCIGNSDAGVVCHGDLYIGCFVDVPQDRPFSGASYTDVMNMTIEHCRSFCQGRGFAYAGLEYGSECYCGSADANYSVHGGALDSECRHACSGNQLQSCGGIARMAVHMIASPTTIGPSTSVKVPDVLRSSTEGNFFNKSDSTTIASSTQTQPLPLEDASVRKLRTIVSVLAVLLALCLIVIIGCIAWNFRLRSRLKKSYDVKDKGRTASHESGGNFGALPYMALSERRRPDDDSYQGLSVQRRQQHPPRGQWAGDEGPYAANSLLGGNEPVYQEPSVYLEPDQGGGDACKVNLPGKPGENEDSLLGVAGNDYEMLGT